MAGWVSRITNLLLLHFRDDNGKTASMKFNIDISEVDPAGGAPAAISTAAQALSESALYETEIQIVALNTDTPAFTGTPYLDPGDKLALEFSNDSDGTITHMQIGAPLATTLSDGWNADPTVDPLMSALAVIQANCVSESGALLSRFLGGHRRRPPRLKKP